MVYPPSPSTPNAPRMHSRALPPSPHTPPSALNYQPGTTLGLDLPHGLATPPTTPPRITAKVHYLLCNPVAFSPDFSLDLQSQLRPLGSAAGQPAFTPPASSVTIMINGGAMRVSVSGRSRGAAVTVQDVLLRVDERLHSVADDEYISRFPRDIQMQTYRRCEGARPHYIDFFGSCVMFAGLRITDVEYGIVTCELELSRAPRR